MPAYLVRWEIEVDAESPLQAAQVALMCMPSFELNESEATFFTVKNVDMVGDDNKGQYHRVDTEEESVAEIDKYEF